MKLFCGWLLAGGCDRLLHGSYTADWRQRGARGERSLLLAPALDIEWLTVTRSKEGTMGQRLGLRRATCALAAIVTLACVVPTYGQTQGMERRRVRGT